LWAARSEMLAQGVRLAGRSRNPAAAIRAVTNRPSPFADDGSRPSIRRWNELASEIRAAREPRVVLSSEFFSWADDSVIRRILADIGSAPVHAVVTLRPLARVMPSMWQQNVQTGMRESLDDWLRGVLRQPPDAANRAFWTLQRHDDLIRRWADALGTERVTAIVVDEGDHGFLLRTFESLLGLRPGTLEPQRDRSNRSLTLPEIEALRAVNVGFREEGLPMGLHARLIRYGAAELMKLRDPDAGEPRVELPAWALEPSAAIQRSIVDGIASSGVRVIGDLDRLTGPPAGAAVATGAVAPDERVSASVAVSPETAAALALGIIVASGEARRARGPGRRFQLPEPVEVTRVPTYQLAGTIGLRALRAVARVVDRVRTALSRRRGAGAGGAGGAGAGG